MLGVDQFTILGEGGLGASAATWIAYKRPHQVRVLPIFIERRRVSLMNALFRPKGLS